MASASKSCLCACSDSHRPFPSHKPTACMICLNGVGFFLLSMTPILPSRRLATPHYFTLHCLSQHHIPTHHTCTPSQAPAGAPPDVWFQLLLCCEGCAQATQQHMAAPDAPPQQQQQQQQQEEVALAAPPEQQQAAEAQQQQQQQQHEEALQGATTAGLAGLHNLRELKSLTLWDLTCDISLSALPTFSQLTALTAFVLSWVWDTPHCEFDPSILAHMAQLEWLALVRCTPARGAAGAAELLSRLSQLHELRRLDLTFVQGLEKCPLEVFSSLTLSSMLEKLTWHIWDTWTPFW